MSQQDDATTIAERPPAGDPPRPPLRRRRDDRILAGVGSGLAAYLNVDPALVRIGLVVLAFANGIGVALYLAAWLLVPEAGAEDPPAARTVRARGPGFWIGIGILVLVALGVADQIGLAGRAVWPLVLIAAGVALWQAGKSPAAAPRTGAPSGPAPGPASETTEENTHMDTAADSRPGDGPRTPMDRPGLEFTPPPVSRPRSILGRVVVAIAFIAAGTTVALDRLDVVSAGASDVFAVVLVVIGLGLVVGAWVGRARWLVVPGLILVPLVAAGGLLTAIEVPLSSGVGERSYRIDAASDLDPDGYHLAAGELTLDLTGLPARGGDLEIFVRVGAGQVNVTVPDGVRVRGRAQVGVGELAAFGRSVNGTDLDEELARPGAGRSLVLDVRIGVGQLVVEAEDPA